MGTVPFWFRPLFCLLCLYSVIYFVCFVLFGLAGLAGHHLPSQTQPTCREGPNLTNKFCFVTPGRPRIVTAVTPPPRSNDELAKEIGGFWESTKARNLFAPGSPLDVGTEVILSSHIDLLEDIMNDPRSLSENVEKKE